MQYVGRLVSSVYNTITPNINPATLSGAIDVIVVERKVEVEEDIEVDAAGNEVQSETHQDEPSQGEASSQNASIGGYAGPRRTKKVKRQKVEYASTPFHVRFGKMSVLRPAERKVTLHLNNSSEPLPFAMKVADSGEAFFVLEIDDQNERDQIPDDLVTSPILSASASPLTSPEVKAANRTDDQEFVPAQPLGTDVEPLDLDGPETVTEGADSNREDPDTDARSGTSARSAATVDTSITTPPLGRALSNEADSSSAQSATNAAGQSVGDLDVPGDSSRTGSGPAGSSSLLDKVGNAASKASGALGAAGRAAVGAGTRGNAKLESVARKAQRADGAGVESAGIDDSDEEKEAQSYEPEQGGPAGKRRQQEHEQVLNDSAPRSEAEMLEQQLKKRALDVLRAEAGQQDAGSSRGAHSRESSVDNIQDDGEERYPAPFGSSPATKRSTASPVDRARRNADDAAKQSSRSDRLETYPVATSRHSEYLGGHRLEAVPGVDADHPIEPAKVNPRLIEARQRKLKEHQQGDHDDSDGQHDGDGDETAVDEDDDMMSVEQARRGKGRKEDMQYMLDMDGYKMTTDGEDLAFQEGHRLADEMPLGRKHGGNGRHGHSEKLSSVNHQHKVFLPTTSTASLRRRSASKTHRPSISMDYRKQRPAKPRDRSGTLGAFDLDDSEEDSVLGPPGPGGGRRMPGKNGQHGGSTLEQDELTLTRDLARLARMNRASESNERALMPSSSMVDDPRSGQQGSGSSRHRRHASLSYARSPSGRASPALRQNAASRRRLDGRRTHFQEFSLSDTEAEVPKAKTSSGRSSLANSTESVKDGNRRLSRFTPALRDLKLPGDETPPQVVLDDTATAHLGTSSNLSWQWGELPRRAAAADDVKSSTGPPAGYRRARFASTDAYESRGHSSGVAQMLGRYSQDDSAVTGKLMSSEWEPYVFRLELDDSSHTFELSLCYKEGFGNDSEGDYYEFEENRVSFQRFVDDAEVVNDERLVVRYNDRFLTWENASAVLATLSLYRKTLSSAAAADSQSPAKSKDDGSQPISTKASYWSRWWSRKSVSDLKQSNAEQQALQSEVRARQLREASAPPAEGLSPAPGGPAIERSATDSILEQKHLVATPDSTEPGRNLDRAGLASAAAASAKRKSDANKTYAKTLRLSSDQLRSLNLRKGANTITFSVTSSYSGVATCTARIFLWESSHKVVVSDIDGTITKSDALGHVFTMIGRDWTHLGVAKLYTDIARNGYRIMYLTSRAIGQADTTRDYLKGIKQNNYVLPDGPVIMSPDRLMASLHREVILRKPEVFKMACLRDIARLFGADPRTAQAQPGGNLSNSGGGDQDKKEGSTGADGVNTGAGADGSPAAGAATASSGVKPEGPSGSLETASTEEQLQKKKVEHATPFYAGFGNRITDALSYRSVNIPSSRIFTIDSNGEVKMELLELAGYKSSYIHMTDLVDQMFPPITAREEKEPRRPEFNDFNYWRPDIVDVELPPDEELLAPAPEPVSPALSARSGKSARSLHSVRSATSDGGPAGSPFSASSPHQAADKPGRLSRFGLGSLGLSRKGSTSTLPAESSGSGGGRHASVGPGVADEELDEVQRRREQRARSASPELETTASSSYGGGVTSWAAPWRRRGASPEFGRATSPLVSATLTADPESEDEGQERYYDSEGDDDDVSSFEGGVEGGGESRDEGLEFGARVSEDGADSAGPDGEDDEEDEEDDEEFGEAEEADDDDPLLAGGEIRFEWRG